MLVTTTVLSGEAALLEALQEARETSLVTKAATSEPSELTGQIAVGKVYSTDQGKAGFGVTHDGSLVAVFNQTGYKGLGSALVSLAIAFGATNLDCFDGKLVSFYQRLGFEEYKRVPNYNPQAPDVVYMQLK